MGRRRGRGKRTGQGREGRRGKGKEKEKRSLADEMLDEKNLRSQYGMD